jgi:hypothetical protein
VSNLAPAVFIAFILILLLRDKFGSKRWRIFQNKVDSSPTTSFRRHLKDHHASTWGQECLRLGIQVEDRAKLPGSTSGPLAPEPFTREGLLKRLVEFVSSDDQVC